MAQVSLRVTEITPQLIDYIRQQIIAAIQPLQIVLFGSQARGDAQPGSDLDLLIVHDTPQSDRQVRRRLERLFLDRRFGMDLIVRRSEEVAMNLADGNPFYIKHIFGEGIILYERERPEGPH